MPPEFLSPSVNVIEVDNSNFATTVNSSIVGLLGFASRGPVNKATLITSQENLVKTFGQPSESIPGQALEGALEILETTQSVYFVRAASGGALDASATVKVGGCPTVLVSGGFYGVSANAYFEIQVANNLNVSQYSAPKAFNVTANTVGATGTQAQALKQIIGGALDSAKVAVEFDSNTQVSGYILGTFAGSGASLAISAWTNSTKVTGLPILVPVNALGNAINGSVTSSLTVIGTTIDSTGASSLSYLVESINPGTGYNLSSSTGGDALGLTAEVIAKGGVNTLLQINDRGQVAEQFKVSLIGSGTFIEDIINTGIANPKSELIFGYLTSGAQDFTACALGTFVHQVTGMGASVLRGSGQSVNNGSVTPRFAKLIQGTYAFSGGTDGYSQVESENTTILIGDPTSNPKKGMACFDDDSLNISIAAVPGIHSQSVQNELITLAEATQNFIALVSPPQGSINTAQEAIDWSNGQSETRTAAINNSWAAIYWPHVKVFSVFDGIDRWYDPAIYAARQMAFNDSVAEAWFAPAGFQRGRLTKPTEVDVVLNKGDRDALYSGGNVINPLVNFPQRGIVIFGQRTAQREPTALDRINVRRLMIYLRKLCLNSLQGFIFEPNDSITWDKIKGVLDPVLGDLQNRRAVTDFKVICDETVNTPIRVDRNELWCKILLKPTKTAEVIVIELNITNQSAQIGE